MWSGGEDAGHVFGEAADDDSPIANDLPIIDAARLQFKEGDALGHDFNHAANTNDIAPMKVNQPPKISHP